MKTKLSIHRKSSVFVVGAVAIAMSVQGSSDYGPAIWRPACSSHHYTSGVGKQFYVEHDMEGYYASTISYLQGCNNSVSVHYCVNGKQDATSDMAAGEVTQMVLDVQYAWHAGCLNQHSMGTEHEGFVSNPAWFTEAMYQASAALTAAKANKYGWPKDRNHVVGHNEWQNTTWDNWVIGNLGFDPRCNNHTDPGPYWDWSHYMALVNPPPPPSSRIDTFYRGTDNACWFKAWDSVGGWYGAVSLAGQLTSDPGVVSWGTGRMDVFVKGPDNALWQRFYSGGTWNANWVGLGGTLAGKPEACSWGVGRIDIFWRGTDNALWHKFYDANAWSAPESLGGTLTADPSAVSWGPGRIDVFSRATDNSMSHIAWSSTGGWSAWESLGGGLAGGPAACSWGVGRLDVFCRGTDNRLHQKVYTAGQPWSGWIDLGELLVSDPAAVSFGPGRIDVFFKGAYDYMWHKWYDGAGWNTSESLGGTLAGSPAACSWYHAQ